MTNKLRDEAERISYGIIPDDSDQYFVNQKIDWTVLRYRVTEALLAFKGEDDVVEKGAIKLSHNIKLVYNAHDQIDGDSKGWYLCVDNESMMRPILKAVAPQRGAKVAIPDYAVYLGDMGRIMKNLRRC